MEDEIVNAVLDKLFEIKNPLILKDIFTRVLKQEIYMKKRDSEASDFESLSTHIEWEENERNKIRNELTAPHPW